MSKEVEDSSGFKVDVYEVQGEICIERNDDNSTRMYFDYDEVSNLIFNLHVLVKAGRSK